MDGLFSDVYASWGYMVSNRKMNNECEKIWKESVLA
jgi:hypothetical protein